MTRLAVVLLLALIVAALVCAASPLICWQYGWDLQLHHCRVIKDTMFTAPYATPEPSATPTDYVLPPMPTHEPEPTLVTTLQPTINPYPIETINPYP